MVYLRILLILIWFLLVSIYGVVMACVRSRRVLDLNHMLARTYSKGFLWISGIKVAVDGDGLANNKPCIYVSNHQGAFDIAIFGAIFPLNTIAIGKKELRYIPLFGWLFKRAGNILIDRNNRIKAVGGLGKAVKIIHDRGVSVWIFPEGTRNRIGFDLLPFKKGAFYMAIAAGIPIVPLVAAPLKPMVDWKSRRLKPGVIQIRVLSAIDTSKLTNKDVDALSDDVRSRMLEAFLGLVKNTTSSMS